eukprot:s802_g13.t1
MLLCNAIYRICDGLAEVFNLVRDKFVHFCAFARHPSRTGSHEMHIGQVSSTAPSPAHQPLEGEPLWPWHLKITDFNSAKRVGACGNGLLLTDRGTQLYNAPELRFGRLWNERIDIWASGLCLYFMLKKHVPFTIGDQKVAGTLLAGSTSKLPYIDWSTMSPLAGNLIRQCLCVEPYDRPTAMELRLHRFFASKRMPESRRICKDPPMMKGSIEHVEVGDRRESKARRALWQERSVMVSSCGLIFMGPARAGGEGRHNRGSVWLEVEERLQRRGLDQGTIHTEGVTGGSKVTAERLSPAFLGARSFPALWSNNCSSPCSSQLPQRHSAADGESSSRMRSHSMYLSTPKACDAMPRSPQQRAKDLDERWKEPRSFDVLLRMANQKFRQMNELLHEAGCWTKIGLWPGLRVSRQRWHESGSKQFNSETTRRHVTAVFQEAAHVRMKCMPITTEQNEGFGHIETAVMAGSLLPAAACFEVWIPALQLDLADLQRHLTET